MSKLSVILLLIGVSKEKLFFHRWSFICRRLSVFFYFHGLHDSLLVYVVTRLSWARGWTSGYLSVVLLHNILWYLIIAVMFNKPSFNMFLTKRNFIRQQEQHDYDTRTKLKFRLPSCERNRGKQRTAFHAIKDFNPFTRQWDNPWMWIFLSVVFFKFEI